MKNREEAAMTSTEPLDIDALISGSNDLVVEAREYIDVLIIANRKPGPSAVDIMSRQADALEALVAEVRRMREESATFRAATAARNRYRTLYRREFTENVRLRRQIEEAGLA